MGNVIDATRKLDPRREAGIRVMEALLREIDDGTKSLESFVFLGVTTDKKNKKAESEYVYADSGNGVSPDLFLFLEASRDRIRRELFDQFYGEDEYE